MAEPPRRVQLVPQVDEALDFEVDGTVRMTWNHARRHPRPCLFPVRGPSGHSVTRMGHPGDWTHDHHRSIWFAHHDVAGVNFWADVPAAPRQIRQERWISYQDGDAEGLMSVRLGWFDDHAVRLLQQDVIIALRPLPGGASDIEVQTHLTTPLPELPLGKTNFGLLAVRVARNLSAKFGTGRLLNSEGAVGEAAIFAKPARWMDYSGQVTTAADGGRREGIAILDHPGNPRQPTHWHVRDDGWMSPSLCLNGGLTLRKDGPPLDLRYLLHVHDGDGVPAVLDTKWKAFADSRPYVGAPVGKGVPARFVRP